jgi:hypothetical protein
VSRRISAQALKFQAEPDAPSVEDKARERSHLGASVGAKLRDAAVPAADADALAISDLITEAASLRNFGIASELYNEFGESFEGLFVLAPLSSSRLDPNYVAECARRSRRRVKEKLAPVVLKYQEELRRRELYLSLVTLTMPTLIGAGMCKTFDVFDDAWRRLRKSLWWKDRVKGGLKGEECTLGDKKRQEREGRPWDFNRDGYHVHAHIMGVMSWLNWTQLGDEWKRCLEASARKHGARMEFATSHGRPVVDVRQVLNRRRGGRSVTFDAAVFEVCKYLVKGSDFARIPAHHLIEVEQTLRGRRMVELLGECNNRKGSARGRGEAKAEAEAAQIERQRRAERAAEAERFLDEAEAHWQAVRGKQHTLDGPWLTTFALACAKRYVHETAQLTEGQPRDGTIRPKKRRAPPLRLVGAEMIRRGLRAEWLVMLKAVAGLRREWRKCDLARRYPHAEFRTLDGGRWFGLLANPASAGDTAEVLSVRAEWRDGCELADEGGQASELEEFRERARRADRDGWRLAVVNRTAFEIFRESFDWREWGGLTLGEAFRIYWFHEGESNG